MKNEAVLLSSLQMNEPDYLSKKEDHYNTNWKKRAGDRCLVLRLEIQTMLMGHHYRIDVFLEKASIPNEVNESFKH